MNVPETPTTQRYAPISPKCPVMLHGGDYNPDQWIATPEIWDEDVRLMKRAGCNAVSVNIFGWSALEPEQGRYEFGWLDTIMDKLADNNIYAIVATPSGGKPAWMSRKYPEIRRVDSQGHRDPHRSRHNHCVTSPIYRDQCVTLNTKLAERYQDHPALIAWHVSNEYSLNNCHCEGCYRAFQNWLAERYDHDIDKLNHAYWAGFWSHNFPDFDYVEPVDGSVHGLMLDWNRFQSDQYIDFFQTESAPLRSITPDIPVTTNFHGRHIMDYGKFSKAVDVIAWDFYPNWHEGTSDVDEGMLYSYLYDRCRSFKNGQPWMLMESVPSIPTRGRAKKRKEPGMHLLSSLQTVAHGSDSVLYFQWRKGRGGMEKFHGAVVDHEGSENTREFKEVAQVGEALKKLTNIVGTTTAAQVAIIEDWENELALNHGARVYLGENIKYAKECTAHYAPFWQAGVAVDVIEQTYDLEPYKLVILPMVYMLRPGFANKLKAFVEAGGTAVMTYWSGVVDESDLCFLGGVPGEGLREVFGVWEEESQSYYAHEKVSLAMAADNELGFQGDYEAVDTCSVIHAEGSNVLATYTDQYFAGSPVLTVNTFGKGKAYYIAARTEGTFLADVYGAIAKDLNLPRAIDMVLPDGVTAQTRTDGTSTFIFLMNFKAQPVTVELDQAYLDVIHDTTLSGAVLLERFGIKVLTAVVES